MVLLLSACVVSNKVVVTIDSSDTKDDWLEEVMAKFNAEEHQTTTEKKIVVEANHVRSGPSKDAILEGESKPTVWSPGDSSWVEQINAIWQQEYGLSINSQPCQATVNAPVGFAMWRPMAEALGWPDQPIGWDTIIELAADPEGWAIYDHPEWGRFSFGHTHPAYSNTGLLSLTSFVYGALETQETLAVSHVYEAEEAMRTLENVTSKYGRSSRAVLELMASEGPGYLHAAAVPEANVARYNAERGSELRFPLAFIIPAGGTIWANHPYCILDNADWVNSEEAEAATIFRDYLLAREQQELALKHYIRPANTTITLHAPLSLEYGVDPDVSPKSTPVLPSPSSEISTAVQKLFELTKRKATVVLVLDISGSMRGQKFQAAKKATIEFLDRLHPEDEVALVIFDQDVHLLLEPGQVSDVYKELSQAVGDLSLGSGTALYDATCRATQLASKSKKANEADAESRLYGIVLLSDGKDVSSQLTQEQMFADCLPSSPEVDGFKLFPVAFGKDANKDVLDQVARVTGGRLYEADLDSVGDVYLSISAEQ